MDDLGYYLRKAGIAVLVVCGGLVLTVLVLEWALPRLAIVLSAFAGSFGGLIAIVLLYRWMSRNRGG